MNLSETFGHNIEFMDFPDIDTKFHKAVDKYAGSNGVSTCNNNMELCRCVDYIAFK